MKNSVTKNSTAACTLLLATSSAFAGGPTKSPSSGAGIPATPPKVQFTKSTPFGINSITLESTGKQVESCDVPKGVTRRHDPKPSRILSLAFNGKAKQSVKLKFDMLEIPGSQEQRVLILLYSRCLSNTPQIQTPNSKQKLVLDKRDMEVMANYPVPAVSSAKGNRASAASTKMSFDVNLDTGFLAHQVNAGDDTFYLQAALLPKADFEKQNYSNVQLSKLEAIQITPNTCPTDAAFSQNLNSDNKSCKKLP
ncbi:MAG TPA: hypothetical protein EYP59_04435 [Thiotrichaceae bacterium]|nr:hypothetical protein [Thiotrichaceae bacterium]